MGEYQTYSLYNRNALKLLREIFLSICSMQTERITVTSHFYNWIAEMFEV